MSPSPVSRPCRAFLDDFSAFVDGHVSPARRAEIQAHVDCCQHCLDHLTAYRRGVTVLRSLEAEAPGDFWQRLERKLWPEERLTVVDGGRDRPREVGRWPVPAVGLAAAAVLALFILVRGLGPESSPARLGPDRVQASVVLTVPQVPEAGSTGAPGSAPDRPSRGRVPDSRRIETIPVATRSAGPAAAALARVDSEAITGFYREPVRLGPEPSRGMIRPASLVRPAIMPAPWNVDQAVSLP